MKFDHMTVEDGLASLTPMNIVQDRDGFLWIGTDNGLNRYDGYELRTYRPDRRDTTSLDGGTCLGMTVDANGDLWISTSTDKIHRYEPDTDSFTRFTIPLPENAPPGNRLIIGRLASGEPGVLWAATNFGLCRFEPHSGNSSFFSHAADDDGTLSHNHITALAVDGVGRIWAGSEEGLTMINRRQPEVRRIYPGPHQPGGGAANFITSLAVDAGGTLWTGTLNGLFRLDNAHARLVPCSGTLSSGTKRFGSTSD